MIDLNNRTFALLNNSENGEVSKATLFQYTQQGKMVRAAYSGGSIASGSIHGVTLDNSGLSLLYHCVTVGGELRAGKASALVSTQDDGRLKLDLEWQWLTGDLSSGRSSYVEVIESQDTMLYENEITHLNAFIALNEEWVAHHFKIEEADRKLAKNPRQIIEDGGFIFSLTLADMVVGVCALFRDADGEYELARMAVRPNFQGKGFGQKLMDTALSKLNNVGAKKVYLLSNKILQKAINLYRKNDFRVISEGKHPVYSRCDVIMERTIP